MNPLDLPGPAFLLFYVVCAGGACIAVHRSNRASEPDVPTGTVPTDPLSIAYLRGGVSEVIRVTALALLERGVLALGPADTLRVIARGPDLPTSVVDGALCHAVTASGGDASALFSDQRLAAIIAEQARPRLERAGLVPDAVGRERRKHRALTAMAGILTLAAVKVAVALHRGHDNVLFLVMAAGAFAVTLWALTGRSTTRAGDRALAYLRHTFEPVRARAQGRAHPPVEDLAVVAAVFGLSAVPDVPYARVGALQPRQAADGSGCGGGGCGGCGGCGG